VQAAFAQHGAQAPTALQFEADAALGEHECRIVSERGQLETSLALQLDAVRDALLDAASTKTAEGAPA
jgi:flagellar biosynthesis/type III secretory pathway protein FliH